jgi:NADP-dependent 3-hydroxy acid dehydrogenase YdfG
MTTALITGATSGIGKATAELFAQNKINLIICGRRKEKLLELKDKLSQLVQIDILEFDICNFEEVSNALNSLGDKLSNIDILINNAGSAHGMDSFEQANIHDMDLMIDTNVKGVLYVTRLVTPHMVKRKSGTIINVSSIAGKESYPNGNVYCASKHAIDGLTKGLRFDLNPYGIKVASINPGMTETEFSMVRFKGDLNKAKATYAGIDPLVANDIADAIYFMASRPPHVVITDLTILPLAQANTQVVNRIKK